MDKEIIDGVDVSECEYFQEDGGENTCRAEEDYTGTVVCCSACDNCYYKQLKRLDQENERLKEELRTEKIYSSQIEELEESLQHAKAENERLKKLKFKSDGIELLQDANLNLHNANVKYRQALQDIKDMADFKCALPSTELCHCKACDYADNILDKINAVIGAE